MNRDAEDSRPANALPDGEDTIVALATPSGRSAVAVTRLSGLAAFAIAGKVLHPWPIASRRAVLCTARSPRDGSLLDRLLVTAFAAPNSYTGEDMVELTSHGGLAVPAALLSALLEAGAREALPGEFTRRAVLNGKLDVIQAEAIGDLIDATSDTMRRIAVGQVDGGLSRRISALREQLLDLEALLAYDIDFPEEDDGTIGRTRIGDAAELALQSIDTLLGTAPVSELVREGAIVVIAGPPNAGKSSLFNALLGESRAIVTDVPGTTRDAIEARVDAEGWPLRLIDTAGLRPTSDIVERLGIEVSERYLAGAHVVIVCAERAAELAHVAEHIGALTSAPIVAVLTKVDRHRDRPALVRELGALGCSAALLVSAEAREGLGDLTTLLAHVLTNRYGALPVELPAVTRTRQRIALERARGELTAFHAEWSADALPAPVAAVHLRAAVGALDELIGAVDVEDVLSRVFATFCVGK
jgi:tRNA modification GTPase